MKIIHCADLHLSRPEEDYSFRVLDELLGLAAKEGAAAILFAGDVFDSRADLEALRSRFRSALEALPAETVVFFIPGNHEHLGASSEDEASLRKFDFGRARLLAERPYSLVSPGPGVEVLGLPFRRDYGDYRDWPVPPKNGACRVLLAHGTVPDLSFSGPDEEGATGVIDPDLLVRFGIDYAALGHVHSGAAAAFGPAYAAYPGSARVWREGEEGPRRALLLDTSTKPPRPETRVLASAGRFVSFSLEARLDGSLSADGKSLEEIDKRDWVRLEVSGLVEDETVAVRELERLAVDLSGRCRKVSLDRKGLDVCAGISSHPLAARFVEAWEKAKPAVPDEAYRLARLQGLKALKEMLESRK